MRSIPAASSAGKPADETTIPKLAQRAFLRQCYHRTCDDIRQPIQYGDAARLARLDARLLRLIGDAASTWDNRQFLGWVPHQMIAYLWPSGPWYWFFDKIGVPDWVAQRLWIATLPPHLNVNRLELMPTSQSFAGFQVHRET